MSILNFNPLGVYLRRRKSSEENILLGERARSESRELKSDEDKVHREITERNCGRCCWSHETAWRLTSALMGIFFFLAAAVQHNDPDPYFWVPAYIIPCILSWVITAAYGQLVNFDLDSRRKERAVETSAPPARRIRTRNVRSKQALTSDPPSITWRLLSKMDTLILLHMLYCFALGLWTLVLCFLIEPDVGGAGMLSSSQKQPGSLEGTMEGFEELQIMAKLKMNDEEAKELLGLCLIIAWLSLLKNRNFIHLGGLGLWLGAGLTLIPFLSWILVEALQEEIMTTTAGSACF